MRGKCSWASWSLKLKYRILLFAYAFSFSVSFYLKAMARCILSNYHSVVEMQESSKPQLDTNDLPLATVVMFKPGLPVDGETCDFVGSL